jgi:hypothetical protein
LVFEAGEMQLVPLVVIALVVSPPAHAYIDPGAASLALQALVGSLAAAGVVLITFAARVKAFFRRLLRLDRPRRADQPGA